MKFIGHASSRDDMKGIGAKNRDNLREHLGETINLFKRALADQKNIAGVPITADERASYLADLSHLERYKDEGRYAEIIPPSVVVDDELSFTRGDRVITIRHLGRAHTGADLVVHLPKENIVITGDLVVWPVPLVGSTSSPASYASTLEKLLAIKAATLIPGHGPVMRNDAYVRSELALLQSLVEQTRAAKASGKSLDETRKVVKLDTFEKTFAGDSRSLAFVFENYVSGSGIAAAYGEPD